jgi:hypothetical protein
MPDIRGAILLLSWNSTIGSRNQRLGGIVQLRGLFAARETQVLANPSYFYRIAVLNDPLGTASSPKYATVEK